MLKKYLLFSLFIISLSSCGVVNNIPLISNSNSKPTENVNYVYLEDVKQGVGLERAKSTTDKKYFEYIMENELGNPNNKPIYETVLETSDQVYFGVIKPTADGSKLIVDPFLSAPIPMIRQFFPGFQDIDGANVKAKVYYSSFSDDIESKVKPNCPNSFSFNYPKYEITLTDKGIRVDAKMTGKCYEKIIYEKQISEIYDAANLDLLQSYSITKDLTAGTETEEGRISETKKVLGNNVGDKLNPF